MTTSRSRRTLLVAFLVLHGAVSLAGPGLHALPWFNHHPAELSHRDDGHGSADLGRETADDCPICQLHNQALFLGDLDARLMVDVVRIRPSVAPPLSLPPAPQASPSPRAPPLV